MKIRVIQSFSDVAFNDKIIRKVGEVIDTTDPKFKCSEDLAKERIRRGFCEEIIEDGTLEHPYETVMPEPVKETPKKGKKVSKKK